MRLDEAFRENARAASSGANPFHDQIQQAILARRRGLEWPRTLVARLLAIADGGESDVQVRRMASDLGSSLEALFDVIKARGGNEISFVRFFDGHGVVRGFAPSFINRYLNVHQRLALALAFLEHVLPLVPNHLAGRAHALFALLRQRASSQRGKAPAGDARRQSDHIFHLGGEIPRADAEILEPFRAAALWGTQDFLRVIARGCVRIVTRGSPFIDATRSEMVWQRLTFVCHIIEAHRK